MKPYKLLDGVNQNRLHPTTFHIPSDEDKAAIKCGDWVKLCFQPLRNGPSERMWVKVNRIDGVRMAGTLDNTPVVFAGILRSKMHVEFEKKHIIGIEEGNMDFYVNPPGMTKEEWLHFNADIVMPVGASPKERTDGSKIAVCLVDCGSHTSAGVAFDQTQFERMTIDDGRARVWFYVETEKLLGIVPGLGHAIGN
jgi:hypothetical protein